VVGMAKIEKAKLGALEIEGYESDYVFETIRKSGDFYEKGILEKWTPYLKGAKVILDIGANLGNHTLYWATNIPNCKIYSFEPYLPTFTLLKNNIELNHLENVDLCNKGVGEKKSFAHVAHVDEKNMGATTLEYCTDNSEGIEIVDIDSFVRENEIEEAIDFIKIDTEGFEADVLKGMESVLHSMYPDIWVEVGQDTCIEVLDKLERLDYCAVDIESANILFLSKKRHAEINSFDKNKVIQKMLYYYQRTNDYYSLYNTVKENYNTVKEKYNTAKENYNTVKENYNTVKENYNIVSEKNSVLNENQKKLKENYDIIREKYGIALNNYETAKQWKKEWEVKCERLSEANQNLKEKLELIKTDRDSLYNENGIYVKKIEDYYIHLKEEEDVLTDILHAVRQLELENRQLREENTRYKDKINRIKSTLLGKIAFKIYQYLKIIRRKVRGR
jgi:FkbM family methyltransferase